ncbi:MAG: response regulator transcription factor [Chloroflexi bacterium]|nr:response regulator transcription factor [Chloroflexota bacterium]
MRHYQARLVPEPDGTGGVQAVLAILHDVTDARRIEEQCAALEREGRSRERRLRELLERVLGEACVGPPPDRRASRRQSPGGVLTDRETTILRLVARGQTNRQIAEELGLSPGTARNYVGRLLSKLGVADRTQAAVRAVHLGLIEREAR